MELNDLMKLPYQKLLYTIRRQESNKIFALRMFIEHYSEYDVLAVLSWVNVQLHEASIKKFKIMPLTWETMYSPHRYLFRFQDIQLMHHLHAIMMTKHASYIINRLMNQILSGIMYGSIGNISYDISCPEHYKFYQHLQTIVATCPERFAAANKDR